MNMEYPRRRDASGGDFVLKNEKKAPVVCDMLYIQHKRRCDGMGF